MSTSDPDYSTTIALPVDDQLPDLVGQRCQALETLTRRRFGGSYDITNAAPNPNRLELQIQRAPFSASVTAGVIFDMVTNPGGGTTRVPLLQVTAAHRHQGNERLERVCNWLTSGSTIVGLATITPILGLAALLVGLLVLLFISIIGGVVVGAIGIILAIFIGGSMGELLGSAAAGMLRAVCGRSAARQEAADPAFSRAMADWQRFLDELDAFLS